MPKSIKHLPLFCRRRNHRHDGLIAELIEQHGCKSERELRALLTTARAWAGKHRIQFTEGLDEGSSGHDVFGYEVRVGRNFITCMTDRNSWKCATYQRLLRAALAALIMTHPTMRAEVESPTFRKQKGVAWNDE